MRLLRGRSQEVLPFKKDLVAALPLGGPFGYKIFGSQLRFQLLQLAKSFFVTSEQLQLEKSFFRFGYCSVSSLLNPHCPTLSPAAVDPPRHSQRHHHRQPQDEADNF